MLSIVSITTIFISLSNFSVIVSRHLESETAPFAGGWGVLVPFVKLDVLHGVAQAHALHATASGHSPIDFYDWHVVDQLLSICHMGGS